MSQLWYLMWFWARLKRGRLCVKLCSVEIQKSVCFGGLGLSIELQRGAYVYAFLSLQWKSAGFKTHKLPGIFLKHHLLWSALVSHTGLDWYEVSKWWQNDNFWVYWHMFLYLILSSQPSHCVFCIILTGLTGINVLFNQYGHYSLPAKDWSVS